jgi:integrase
MTAMATGLRAGELQGLMAGDLGDGCLLVRHSWNRYDKPKTTKNNEERVVQLPFPSVMDSLKYTASLNPHGGPAMIHLFSGQAFPQINQWSRNYLFPARVNPWLLRG